MATESSVVHIHIVRIRGHRTEEILVIPLIGLIISIAAIVEDSTPAAILGATILLCVALDDIGTALISTLKRNSSRSP